MIYYLCQLCFQSIDDIVDQENRGDPTYYANQPASQLAKGAISLIALCGNMYEGRLFGE
ncbi:hypothetical protein KDA_26190 [Dictyobacter alpinus]|uniref:Uncharacterized protein n=1 Tax=Dictyobacter alpinus TaxID=2014873 RepID=A0A402B702_9CHLR|nr:hypothetical protein KDA_26190 [Dictyobacter alpinus]